RDASPTSLFSAITLQLEFFILQRMSRARVAHRRNSGSEFSGSLNFRRRTGKDRQSAQLDVLRKQIVPIFQRLGIVQVVSRVVIQHLLRITCGGSVLLHGSLIEILFKVVELEQERNWRCVTNERNG